MNGACDDGLCCNGAEMCDPVAGCQPGTALNCDDGVACTVDSCNETTDACDHTSNNAVCSDGLFCNGAEVCDPGPGASRGRLRTAMSVACTVDSCNETTDCDHAPVNGACGDGLFCNGAEVCDPVAGCQPGTAANCDDGVACTVDSCNETTDSCDHAQVNGACGDGLFCNGAEACDPVAGCQPGTAPNCDDGVACTTDSLQRDDRQCEHAQVNGWCSDGLFCNGAECATRGAGASRGRR